MDSDRPHRTGSTSSELFICFTSRLSSSSSSMKFSSKSILSPCRSRDPPISLSTSLSRRLRTNRSIKGGQASPMFPTGGKKRGCGFENPEPSSPKVTCIGQVRVKTMKQGKKMRPLSRRRSGSGEVSFRKVEQVREGITLNQNQNQNQNHSSTYQQTNASNQQQESLPHRNQRWVHLPLTICEALRAFGAEFSCLFPCRSSCFSTTEREKAEKVGGSREGSGQSSCGSVFARWLTALQDGEGGKGREIEVVVGGDEVRTELTEKSVRNSRRHVFDEIEFTDEKCEVKDDVLEENEARVSICVPPKNALLLMRCRSDPMRMADLANRFWESPVPEDDDDNENESKKYEENGDGGVVDVKEYEVNDDPKMEQKEDEKWVVSVEVDEEQEHPEVEENLEMEVKESEEKNPQESLEIYEELQEENQDMQEEETEVNQTAVEEENALSSTSSTEAPKDQESKENREDDPNQEKEVESRASYRSSSVHSAEEHGESEEEEEEEAGADEAALELEAQGTTGEKETEDRLFEYEEIVTHLRSELEETIETPKEGEGEGKKSEESERESGLVKQQERERTLLPDCLMLMMCEPKLSMEVSKETWVCSTDFIRWQPERTNKPKGGGDGSKKRVSIESSSNPAHSQQLQPPRSSCSFPAPVASIAGMSMATMIEEKLVNAVGCKPFVLPRCKSEPMRTASRLAPEACFWKNGKLEPHRRATFGIGAAGVGC